jgi:hypothetical protein
MYKYVTGIALGRADGIITESCYCVCELLYIGQFLRKVLYLVRIRSSNLVVDNKEH